ncbi:MAG: hypothetical protein E6I19_10450 [Chloroflexi bacterium]|nr:MAG: hypothetical protein E6I19_10450 [Chloroflexota bacterium]
MTLRRVGETAVPRGAKPGFDHADVYTKGSASRMYVAHTGADRIDVFDCARATYIHALDGHPGVGAARLCCYRASDETLVAQVAVGQRPNGVAFDTRRMRAYTFDIGDPPGAGCTATAVDLATSAVLATIALPGRPRWAIYDPASGSVYANISDPPCIVVIDSGTQLIMRTIDVPSAGPHGLALIDGLLFCATDAGELIVLEPNGIVRQRLPLAGVPDVVMWDRDLARIYVAIGSPGVVQSFDTKAPRLRETIETEEGAHTIGWDPMRKQLWGFAPRSCGAIVYQESA